MDTKSIEKVNIKIKEQLDKVQEALNKLVNEIENFDEWIYIENKKVILSKEKYVVILNTKFYDPCMHDSDESDKLLKAEGLKWNIPTYEEIKDIINQNGGFPNRVWNNSSGYLVLFKEQETRREFYCIASNGRSAYYNLLNETCNSIFRSVNLFPIIRIDEKNLCGIVKFILDNEFIVEDLENLENLKELIKFNKSYPFIIKNNEICVDEEKILADLKNNELKVKFSINSNELIEILLNVDKERADIEAYDEKILFDPNRGHWNLWNYLVLDRKDDETEVTLSENLIARNPKDDIKKSGIVAIDFGTKSTIVVHQEKNNYTLPMRVGMGRFSKAVESYHYENPTVMEFINIDNFLKDYNSAKGRPETKWGDLTISHTASNSLLNSSSEHYYSYFSELKQWCGNKDKKIKIKDKNKNTFDLPSFLEIKENDLNPIEIYAYYLGTYINNMHNGIYLKYILSFPVTYEKEIRNKIIKSFEYGLKKSLPETLLNDEDVMSKFKVEEGANEPAAYAISALQAYEFEPNEDEQIFYGVFDFGGGTTDFDFGIWRLADEETEDRYDYVIEHFGAGGDRYLGGENLLELLAFEVFKDNADSLREAGITFMLPPECRKFPGSEVLLSESEEAKLNMRQLMEKLRPITEHHEDYEEKFSKGVIGVNLYNQQGEQVTNFSLNVDLESVEEKLKERIEKGVRNFFESLRLSFENSGIEDIEKVNILLAGNSSKSRLVKEIFNEYIELEELEISKVINKKGIFELYPPLGTEDAYIKQEELGIKVEKNNLEKPTGKTGVAFGLIDSRKGGNIKVINRNVEDSKSDVRFKFFIGRQKRKYFKVYMDRNIEYGQWVKFIDGTEEDFEVYYTMLPEASTNKLSITEVDRLNLSIEEPNDDAYIYLRAVNPTSIEYVLATEEGINNGEFLSETKIVSLD